MLHTYICILLSNRYAPVDLICFTISHPSLLLGMEVGLNNGGISFTRKDTQRIKTTELPAKAGLQFEKFTQIITIGK